MQQLIDIGVGLLPFALTLIGVIFILWLADRLVVQRSSGPLKMPLHRQLVMLGLTLLGLLVVFLALPMESSLREQLLGVLGVVLTGIVAFSSTSFVANIMAGLMLRSVKSFSPGDFIRVGDCFGRVTERGLFHTEVQSEDRDLITLPNLFLATNPVQVVSSSGTVITCDISLGYDIPHSLVESLLKKAATDIELEEPFVQVLTLGDYSITYRAAGFYREVKHLLSTRSALRKAILDRFHSAGIEIVSPSFMNQRMLDAQQRFIPSVNVAAGEAVSAGFSQAPEAIMFDKADMAEKRESLEEKRATAEEQLKLLKKTTDKNDHSQGGGEKAIHDLEMQIAAIDRMLAMANNPDEK